MIRTVPTGLPLVSKKSGKFKVWEKSGNFEKSQWNSKFSKSQGNSRLVREILTLWMKILLTNVTQSCLMVMKYDLCICAKHLVWGTLWISYICHVFMCISCLRDTNVSRVNSYIMALMSRSDDFTYLWYFLSLYCDMAQSQNYFLRCIIVVRGKFGQVFLGNLRSSPSGNPALVWRNYYKLYGFHEVINFSVTSLNFLYFF